MSLDLTAIKARRKARYRVKVAERESSITLGRALTARLGERFDIKLILDGLEKIGWRIDRKHSKCWCPDHANQALSEGKE